MKLAPVCLVGLAPLLFAAAAPKPPEQRTTLESARLEFWTVGNETYFVFDRSAEKRVTLIGTDLKIVCDHLELTALGVDKPGAKNKPDPTAALPSPTMGPGAVSLAGLSLASGFGRSLPLVGGAGVACSGSC